MASHPSVADLKDLTLFNLDGKRAHLRYINEYDQLSFALRQLLFSKYEDHFHGVFRLAPIPFVQFNASVRSAFDGSKTEGYATAEYNDHETVRATATVSTSPQEHFESSIRYSDPKYMPKGWTGTATLSHSLHNLVESLPTVSIGTHYKRKGAFVAEVYASNTQELGGWVVSKISPSLRVAGTTKYSADQGQFTELEFVVSYLQKLHEERRNRGILVTSPTNYYQLLFGVSNFGNAVTVGYFQHLKLGSYTTKRNHHVSLGGEFSFRKSPDVYYPSGSTLTVGGSWQVSSNSLVKAKFNTQGNAEVLGAFRVGQAPMFTVALTLGKSFKTGDFKKGISIVFED